MSAEIVRLDTQVSDLAAWLRRLAVTVDKPASEARQVDSVVVVMTHRDGTISLQAGGEVDDDVVIARLAVAQTTMSLGALGIIPVQNG